MDTLPATSQRVSFDSLDKTPTAARNGRTALGLHRLSLNSRLGLLNRIILTFSFALFDMVHVDGMIRLLRQVLSA